jgi:hypothetical protein
MPSSTQPRQSQPNRGCSTAREHRPPARETPQPARTAPSFARAHRASQSQPARSERCPSTYYRLRPWSPSQHPTPDAPPDQIERKDGDLRDPLGDKYLKAVLHGPCHAKHTFRAINPDERLANAESSNTHATGDNVISFTSHKTGPQFHRRRRGSDRPTDNGGGATCRQGHEQSITRNEHEFGPPAAVPAKPAASAMPGATALTKIVEAGTACAQSPSRTRCCANPAGDGMAGWDGTVRRRCSSCRKPSLTWAFCWSGRPGSNRRPQPWQGCALPTELRPQRPATVSGHRPITNPRPDQLPTRARTPVATS